jgi:hypothetical protein
VEYVLALIDEMLASMPLFIIFFSFDENYSLPSLNH